MQLNVVFASAYVRNAAAIINWYDGATPLATYLRQYFAQNKKYGSKDRKHISRLVHQYYRLGFLGEKHNAEEKLLLAEWLCSSQPSPLLQAIAPEWFVDKPLSFTEKLEVLNLALKPDDHTPWLHLLQGGTSHEAYVQSFFTQPKVFARIRPKHRVDVEKIIQQHYPEVTLMQTNVLAFEPGIKLENHFAINRQIVVQDASSAACGTILRKHLPDLQGKIWDACAASGGKSIMLYDLFDGNIELLATDIRPSILHNLKIRFAEAGIRKYQTALVDLTKPVKSELFKKGFEVIVADVPCTGSGTWARTPEQHHFFEPALLKAFTQRQQSIVKNLIPHVNQNGYLIYITCSVFEAENEKVVNEASAKYGLKILHQQAIHGFTIQADSMYIAILQKA